MIVKLLTEQHLEFLSLKGNCIGSSESTLVKMSNCWKSHATAHILYKECPFGHLVELTTIVVKQNRRIEAAFHLDNRLNFPLIFTQIHIFMKVHSS